MKDEPVNTAWWVHLIAGFISMLAAKYLPTFGVSDAQALAIAGALFAAASRLISKFTRSKVMPMAKIEERLAMEHPAALAALKRPS